MSAGSINELPRYQPENPYNYSNVELAQRTKAIKDIQKDYPKVNISWVEWLYDTIENLPEAEVQDIIEKNLWDKPGRHSNVK